MLNQHNVHENCLPSEQDVAFFDENGYLVSPVIFSQEELIQIKEHQDKMYNGDYETEREPVCNWLEGQDNPRALRKTDNSHWSDRSLLQVATNPTIGAIAAKLMHSNAIRFIP